MSITVHSSTWASDPSMLASGLALAGALGSWLVGRFFALFGHGDESARR